jgi:hypothetical protein
MCEGPRWLSSEVAGRAAVIVLSFVACLLLALN